MDDLGGAPNLIAVDPCDKKSTPSVSTVSTIDSPASVQECSESAQLQKVSEENGDGNSSCCFDNDAEIENDENDDEVSSLESENTAVLLEHAKDRVLLQDIQEEVKQLKDVIAQKDIELNRLSEQLRNATAYKCDLILAQNELEMYHRQSMKSREKGLMQLKKANLSLQEEQSKVEMDLLNEICELTQKIKEVEALHEKELEERELSHQSEIAMKDLMISCLQEELRKAKGADEQPPSH
jgi:hypothetical protein